MIAIDDEPGPEVEEHVDDEAQVDDILRVRVKRGGGRNVFRT